MEINIAQSNVHTIMRHNMVFKSRLMGNYKINFIYNKKNVTN